MDRFAGEQFQGIPSESTLLFGGLIVLLLIQGLVRIQNPGYWQELFHSLISLNYVLLMLREGKLQWSIPNILLDLLFLFSTTFYIEQVVKLTTVDFSFWQILIGVTGFFAGQLLLAFLLGNILYTYKYIYPFIINMIVFKRALGIVMLPLAMLVTYGGLIPKEAWVGIVAIVAISFLMFRAVRALFQMQSLLEHGIIYNFWYLCIVEIAPLIIVIDRILTLI